MPLTVVSFAAYLTTSKTRWRDEDHSASQFVKAAKGISFNGYGHVPVCGRQMLLQMTNAQEAVNWFGEMAAAGLKRLPRGAVLVPIPNSGCGTWNNAVPRTMRLAEALARCFDGVRILDCLRWKTKLAPSSKGGTRNPQMLYDALAVTRKVKDSKLILVDDVCTTAGHLLAARALLIEHGAECSMAICVGRTVHDSEPDPFAVLKQELEDFEPA
jgi:hypothetical protein